ncbi:MAG: hypothetical protein K2L34_04940 [Muribaculaceae bacterium]|nr:hypothetical protein [Muribaculaceae bacterium]
MKADKDSELESLYTHLDEEIARSGDYEKLKEERIVKYKRDYDLTTDKNKRTEIINNLIAEFDAYNADSTLYYINYNLRLPAVEADAGERMRLLIKRADVFAHAGLFSDALGIMKSIPRDSVPNTLLEDYYSTYCAIYQYLSEYTSEHETAPAYEQQRTLYADSLNQVVRPDSFNHMVYVMTEMARRGDSDKAIDMLSKHLEEYPSGTREYSILASTLAYIYKEAGYPKEYKRYLVLSAISDVKGAVKENMSFRAVATDMFEDGDIERANRYLKKSIADANFYSALMRNVQSSKMLPVIDEAYNSVQQRLTSRLRSMVWVSSILSVILIITIVLILKQFRSLRVAKDKISNANKELSLLSDKLKAANGELEKSNDELQVRNEKLHEYNLTKEQYAGLFMEYCSAAISALQHYQQSLRKIAVQGSNRATLLKKIESSETVDQLLKDFYAKFDEAILNIYPSFVDKFSALLKPEEKPVLKNGELLNTELRVFALIRIGIEDSAQIANFLRCSLSTVYTYRSKMKKRALNPDRFEQDVKNIG